MNIIPAYLPTISLHVLHEVNSVHTVGAIETFHPLIRVLSSLQCDPHNLRCASKVNLQVLVSIVVLRGPGSHVSTAATSMKPSEEWGMVGVVKRRGCDHAISDSTILHSHWSVAKCTCEEKEQDLLSNELTIDGQIATIR